MISRAFKWGAALAVMLVCAAAAQAQEPRADWTPDRLVMEAYGGAIAVSPLRRRLAERLAIYERGISSAGNRLDHADDLTLVEELTRLADRDERARAMTTTVEGLAEGCVDIVLRGCSAPMGGFINLGRAEGEPDRRVYWQTQSGHTDEDGLHGGFVLLAREGETLTPIVWDYGGYVYGAPVSLGRDAAGAELIAVPGTFAGTGSHNADIVLRWTPGANGGEWIQIDNWSWMGEVEERLPEGLEVWKGVAYNYEARLATTPLWRPDDGNCCPTGGSAILSFEIQDDRLVLTDVRVSPAS